MTTKPTARLALDNRLPDGGAGPGVCRKFLPMRQALCVVAALSLSGCGTLSAVTGGPGQTDNAEVLRALGEHLDKCDRHYQGGFGLGASFTFTIDCQGQSRGAAATQP